ncbi:MAG: hypothetical protein EPO00_01260 [Chloroflexota bacterium]|nr:MAG: hypothetical protein EPO00_01260 [Chloroflexota bacterium]
MTMGARCEPHRLAHERARREHRDPAETQFYGSAAWQRLRAEVLDDAGGRCETRVEPDGRACGAPADSAGHLIPWRQRPDLGLDRANVAAQCRRHQALAIHRAPGALVPR